MMGEPLSESTTMPSHEAAVPLVARRMPTKSRLWIRALTVSVLVCVTIGVLGYLREPTGPASGNEIQGALPNLPANQKTFRVGTLNKHSGFGEDDVYNLNRTIEAVRGTDLCGLNEVRGRLFGQPANQAQELAQAIGDAWLYLPSERRLWHDDFGNGLLTRLPIANWIRSPLPAEPHHGGYRNVTVASVQFGSRRVEVVVTHIDRASDQSNQIQFITRLFSSLEQPSILLGDLNANSDNPQIQNLLSIQGIHECLGEATGQTRGRIDWILCRGLQTVSGGEIKNGASDHPMYWVDLQFP